MKISSPLTIIQMILIVDVPTMAEVLTNQNIIQNMRIWQRSISGWIVFQKSHILNIYFI